MHISANAMVCSLETHLDALSVRQRDGFLEYVKEMIDNMRPKPKDPLSHPNIVAFQKLRTKHVQDEQECT